MVSNPSAVIPQFGVLSPSKVLTDASGPDDYTGLGFEPSAVVAIGIGAGGANRASIGVSDGSNEGIISQLASSTWSEIATHGIRLPSASNAYQRGVITMIADGVRISWTKTGSPTGTVTFFLLCFG